MQNNHFSSSSSQKVLLKNSDMKIYEIAESLNFPEPTAFNRYFKKQTGLTPAAYRKNNPS